MRCWSGSGSIDFVDVFRSLHGYADRAPSWHGSRRGYRLDHVLASPALRPSACRYLDEVRTERLSDHAAVEAVFELPQTRAEP